MRVHQPCFVVTFPTTTAALAFERYAGEIALPGRLIPIPRQLSAGCGLSWKLICTEAPKDFRKLVQASGVMISEIAELNI